MKKASYKAQKQYYQKKEKKATGQFVFLLFNEF